jgi:hypothetical protein
MDAALEYNTKFWSPDNTDKHTAHAISNDSQHNILMDNPKYDEDLLRKLNSKVIFWNSQQDEFFICDEPRETDTGVLADYYVQRPYFDIIASKEKASAIYKAFEHDKLTGITKLGIKSYDCSETIIKLAASDVREEVSPKFLKLSYTIRNGSVNYCPTTYTLNHDFWLGGFKYELSSLDLDEDDTYQLFIVGISSVVDSNYILNKIDEALGKF